MALLYFQYALFLCLTTAHEKIKMDGYPPPPQSVSGVGNFVFPGLRFLFIWETSNTHGKGKENGYAYTTLDRVWSVRKLALHWNWNQVL
ncbi:hypothetical protein B0J13DRAFT_253809 [Dactylonectria estremocensis]|uniref:Secreted protein n=1 Tax=Dactylonectria estremocensis TaxID=1079267 RepID=A0A9P9JA19_9HYPO|nr:hypothetical protein B0J13DRAFT_253809 [Dactylonectria estremocensis]